MVNNVMNYTVDPTHELSGFGIRVTPFIYDGYTQVTFPVPGEPESKNDT
jgi:hypothetical protein